MKLERVTLVSCDIAGHSTTPFETQVDRVAEINKMVAAAIDAQEPGEVVWASGGDGGHVVFRGAEWQRPAIELALTFGRWSKARDVPLRTVCHRGEVAVVPGADGRIQPVGDAINCAGWLLKQSVTTGITVSDSFHRETTDRQNDLAIRFHDPHSVSDLVFPVRTVSLMSGSGFDSSWEQPPVSHPASS